MRILDCFMFFNELDLLRVRMEELGTIVDAFVLVEGTHSHSGATKPIYSTEARRGISTNGKPLVSHIADLSGFSGADRWQRERGQRDALMGALAAMGCAPDDVILLSDADEIPRAAALPAAIEMVRRHGIAVLEQTLHRFYLNNVTIAKDHHTGWCGTIAVRYEDLLRSTPSRLRGEWCGGGQLSRFATRKQRRVLVPDAGWHFTYMGGPGAVIQKRQNFAHVEGDDPELSQATRDRADAGAFAVADCKIYGGACPCGCTWGHLPQAYVDATSVFLSQLNLPESVKKRPDDFAHWIRSVPPEPIAVQPASAGRVEVIVLRDDAAVNWLIGRIDTGRLPPDLHVIDVRPGSHAVPPVIVSTGMKWILAPSMTPARALNRLLLTTGAEEVRRWFPGVSAPLPVLSVQALRAAGDYDEAMPAGEEWALRWSLAAARLESMHPAQGIGSFEPATRGSVVWDAQLYVCAIFTGRRASPRSLAAWRWRLWASKERVLAGQWRNAWREIAC